MMGRPTPFAGRRSRGGAAVRPSMPIRLPSNAAAAACRSRQRPRACSARGPSRSPGFPAGPGSVCSASRPPRGVALRQSALRPAVAGDAREVPEGPAEAACRPWCASAAAETATWRTVPGAVHLPPTAVPRTGGTSARCPAPRIPGFPGECRVSPTRPGVPGLPGSPRPCRSGLRRCRARRRRHAAHCTRVIRASPFLFC